MNQIPLENLIVGELPVILNLHLHKLFFTYETVKTRSSNSCGDTKEDLLGVVQFLDMLYLRDQTINKLTLDIYVKQTKAQLIKGLGSITPISTPTPRAQVERD